MQWCFFTKRSQGFGVWSRWFDSLISEHRHCVRRPSHLPTSDCRDTKAAADCVGCYATGRSTSAPYRVDLQRRLYVREAAKAAFDRERYHLHPVTRSRTFFHFCSTTPESCHKKLDCHFFCFFVLVVGGATVSWLRWLYIVSCVGTGSLPQCLIRGTEVELRVTPRRGYDKGCSKGRLQNLRVPSLPKCHLSMKSTYWRDCCMVLTEVRSLAKLMENIAGWTRSAVGARKSCQYHASAVTPNRKYVVA